MHPQLAAEAAAAGGGCGNHSAAAPHARPSTAR